MMRLWGTKGAGSGDRINNSLKTFATLPNVVVSAMTIYRMCISVQDGAPKIAKLPHKWSNYGLW